MAKSKETTMQRIQVGTLGLAAVLILVTAANMVISRADESTGDIVNTQAGQDSPVSVPTSQEPLAEIGVAAQVDADQEVKKPAASKLPQPTNMVTQPQRSAPPVQ